MTCPHCHKRIEDNAARLKRRRHQRGQCIDCAGPLSAQEKVAGHWRCFTCRQHVTVLRRRREAKAADALRLQRKAARLARRAA